MRSLPGYRFARLRSPFLIVWISLFLMSMTACLDASQPNISESEDLTPDDPSEFTELSAQLSLSQAALADLGEQAVYLTVAVYRLNTLEDSAQTLELSAKRYDITGSGVYEISGLSVGYKLFEVMLYDGSGLLLASAQSRASIGLGSQTIDPIVLIPKKISEPLLVTAQVILTLADFPPVQDNNGSIEPFEDKAVTALMKSQNCSGCHASTKFPPGLDLSQFPFQSTNYENSTAGFMAIVEEMVRRVKLPTNDPEFMPLGRTMSENEISTFENYLMNLKATAASERQARLSDWVGRGRLTLTWGNGFMTSIPLGVVDQSLQSEPDALILSQTVDYEASLELFGLDGESLTVFEPIEVVFDEDGLWRIEREWVYDSPSVQIPIEVKR